MTIFVDNMELSASISNSFKNKLYLVLFTKISCLLIYLTIIEIGLNTMLIECT